MKVRNHKELEVWKRGIDIVDRVYDVTARFPKEQRYTLSSQLQRAALSIPSNIAEGFARQYTKEYRQFCYIALGSCAEVETQLIVARRRNYLNDQEFTELERLIDVESRMLNRLIQALARDVRGKDSQPPATSHQSLAPEAQQCPQSQ